MYEIVYAISHEELRFCCTVMRNMIDNPEITQPSVHQMAALTHAKNALEKYGGDPRDISVLKYHASNPGAYLYRDKYTMSALRAGMEALVKLSEEVSLDGK